MRAKWTTVVIAVEIEKKRKEVSTGSNVCKVATHKQMGKQQKDRMKAVHLSN